MAETISPGRPTKRGGWSKAALCNKCGAVVRLFLKDLIKQSTGRMDCSFFVLYVCPCCQSRETLARVPPLNPADPEEFRKLLDGRPLR